MAITGQIGYSPFKEDKKEMSVDINDLNRAAEDLRKKMAGAPDINNFEVIVVPDDMEIQLKAIMKDGSICERTFRHK